MSNSISLCDGHTYIFTTDYEWLRVKTICVNNSKINYKLIF